MQGQRISLCLPEEPALLLDVLQPGSALLAIDLHNFRRTQKSRRHVLQLLAESIS